MAMEKSNTSSRVAMALMCGLAICCAVMYMTADGNEEVMMATDVPDKSPSPGTSVSSEDILKTGLIITETPDGRLRLTQYLNNVENEISQEEAARKKDVAEVKAQMARNFAFNKAARAKLEKAMLAKMAVNAKKAKDDLHKAMTFVQGKFAAAADLQNKRNNANIARSAKLRSTIAANKAEAQKHLASAVLVQQRAMSALASATNARIAQTDKNVAINAAQIKVNAKKARDELDGAVQKFDQKIALARAQAAAGRSKLQEQLNTQDKATRGWANNKLKIVVAKTAEAFAKTREKMADDRHHADIALTAASTRMSASLNAFKALNDERFKKTVADIEAAKKEADERIAAAQASFKVGLLKLTATVNEQVKKTNARVDQLTNTVDDIKTAQAKVNANVNAELKRMMKLGQDRYAEHMAKDKELKGIIDQNQADTEARMKAMSAHYLMELNAVRGTMKKNRAYATKKLSQETAKLYTAIAKSEQEQLATNEALADQTRRAKLDIADALRDAKADFATRLGNLHTTVVANDKKFEGKILKLTGIVEANAVKNAQGRQQLSDIMDSNKKELKANVRDAVHAGEVLMGQKEAFLVNLNKKTKDALNMKITTEISALTKRANGQIENLRLNSKQSRDEMRRELLYAIRSMAEEAKKNLDAAKDSAAAKFDQVFEHEKNQKEAAAADREAIAQQIADMKEEAKQELDDGVATMHRTMLALKYETETKIKKTNTKIDAYAVQLKKEVEEVDTLMKQQMVTLTKGIEDQKKAASDSITAAGDEAGLRHDATMAAILAEFGEAEKKSSAKFSAMYVRMAEQRQALDLALATAVDDINRAISKQAGIQDSRFEFTVKDIKAARAEAHAEVAFARKEFSTGLDALRKSVEEMDSMLTGQVQAAAGEIIDYKAKNARVNRHVKAEIKRIEDLMNHQQSVSIRARGKLRAILNEYKELAAQEVKELDSYFQAEIEKIEEEAKNDADEAAHNLQLMTAAAYEKMAEYQTLNIYANEDSAKKISVYSAEAQQGIADSKAGFTQALDDMVRVVASHYKKMKDGMEKLTGVVADSDAASAEDRQLIRTQMGVFEGTMRAKIADAIMAGEAKAKAVEDRARANLAAEKQALLIEISNTVEKMADDVFKVIQDGTGTIADNYLSLKAYSSVAGEAVNELVAKGHGKILSSIGDLLLSCSQLTDTVPEPTTFFTESDSMPDLFSGGDIKIDYSVSRINALVNEYVKLYDGVLSRYPYGLGKYLLLKADASMRVKGVLKVEKIQGKAGNWVMIDSHTLGMSHKMDTFEHLAVRMQHYEDALAALTAKLSGTKPASITDITKKPLSVGPPEWPGN